MVVRIMNKSKERLLIIFITFTLLVTVIYLYLNHMQETFKTAQWSEERCSSELKSVKYQLNVVTDYKNRLDKLLTESQNAHESDKARFKDIMENCVAMKQQTAICQSQFEDLQSECMKVRKDYDKVLKDLEKLKSSR